MRKALAGLAIFLLLVSSSSLSPEALGSTAAPKRAFYLTQPLTGSPPIGTLATSFDPTGCPCLTNLTASPAVFPLQAPLQSPATLNGPIVFSIWANLTSKSAGSANLGVAFSYRFPGQGSWTNQNSTQLVPSGLTNVTIPVNIATTPLIEQSALSIEIYAVSVSPANATLWLKWGSIAARSFVSVPMSDYEGLFPANTITVGGSSNTLSVNSPPYFYLDASNTLVEIKTFVVSAFGISDISGRSPGGRVNMTIIDPNGRPVIQATNLTMSIQNPAPLTGPYAAIASWLYHANSTQGTYQVEIDMIDSQANRVYSFRGPGGSFSLVPPGFIPFPYNLYPYFIAGGIGGGAIVGGIFYYRRKGKSYLAPFSHFATLTAGELDGGTVSIEGNTGSGKTILSEQLMFEDLKRGKPCVFVSTSDFPANVRSGMKSMGLDTKGYEQSGLLTFVDGYSAEAGQESTEKFTVPSIGDLTTLGMKISSSIPPQAKGASLYFDSLVPLASKTKPESIVSFVQSVGAKMKGIGGKAVFTLGPSVDLSVQKQLEDMSDCVVQMEAFEERGVRRRRLKIAKLRARRHQVGWNVFAIEEGKGIIFYSKKPKT